MVSSRSGQGTRGPWRCHALFAAAALVGAAIFPRAVVVGTTAAVSGNRRNHGKIRAAWTGSSRADTAFPLVHLHFCLGCPHPAVEGSLGEDPTLEIGAELRWVSFYSNDLIVSLNTAVLLLL